MIETPRIIQTECQLTAIIHVTVPCEEIRNVMGPALEELRSTMAAQGVAPAGPWFTHHLRRPSDTFDFEVSIPVAKAVAPAERVQPSEWPAMTVARTVYHGNYEGLGDAWGEFLDWIEANGRTPAEDLCEVYTVGPDDNPDPGAWRTELSKPLIGRRAT
jgi:effector-binding domain-containing protein